MDTVVMHPELATILENVWSPDADVKNWAVVQLWYLLESNSRWVAGYSPEARADLRRQHLSWLSGELLDQGLTDDLERNIVENMFAKLNEEPDHPGLISALGAANEEIALEPLLKFIDQRGEHLDDQCIHSAQGALGHWLWKNLHSDKRAWIRLLLIENDPTDFLERASKSRDDETAYQAGYALAFLAEYLSRS